MEFQSGETVSLNGISYQIQDRLASGAVADVYAATFFDPTSKIVIKLVRDDAGQDPLKIAGIQREAEVLKILNRAQDPQWPRSGSVRDRFQRAQETAPTRSIIALLDDGEITPRQPFLVQEMAPPAFERFEISGLPDERRMISVTCAVAQTIALAHRYDLTLQDFEPYTKADRIRVRWLDDESARFELKMIDWNVTGGPEHVAQDLFFFGRHMYYFLTGRHLALDVDDRPPANLSLGSNAWESLTEGSRQILRQLLRRDPRRRYQHAAGLETDMAWWLDTLAQTTQPDPLRRLDDRIWQARPAGRYDRVMAVADLALRLDPPPESRQAFELSLRQAREELDKENWQPIAQARATLLTGAFEKADGEFGRELRSLAKDSEAARLARLYQRLARIGALLKNAQGGGDTRSTPVWETLTRAIGALVQQQRHWREAQGALLEASRLQPGAAAWQPFNDLLDVTRAGILVQEVAELSAQAEPRPADAERDDWAKVEAEQIETLKKAVAKLQEAQALAPSEPEFGDRFKSEQKRLEQRQNLLARYRDADKFIAQADAKLEQAHAARDSDELDQAAELYRQATETFQAALNEFKAILDVDQAQHRARIFQARLQPRHQGAETEWQIATAFAQGRDLARQGEYVQGVRPIRQAAKLVPGRAQAQELLAEAEFGAQLLRETRRYLASAQESVERGDLNNATEQLNHFLPWLNKRLADCPKGSDLPDIVGMQPFRLPETTRNEIGKLQERIQITREAEVEARKAWENYDYVGVVRIYERLEQKQIPLAQDQTDLLEQARQRGKILIDADTLVRGANTFDDLRQAFEMLINDPHPRAEQLRLEIGDAWQRLSEGVTDWAALNTLLQEGIRSFEGQPVVEQLRNMDERVTLLRGVERELELPAERQWPHGLDSADWPRYLSRQTDALMELTGTAVWLNLRQDADALLSQLVDHVADFLRTQQIEAVHEQIKKRRFERAFEIAEYAWQNTPESLRSRLPSEVADDGLVHLRTELNVSLQAIQAQKSIAQRLTDNEITFDQAAREAGDIQLPSPPLPSERLKAFLNDLKQATSMRQKVDEKPTLETHAELINQQRNLSKQSLAVLDRVSELSSRVETLRNELKTAASETTEQLYGELGTLVEAQIARPKTDPGNLVRIYIQALWEHTSAQRMQLRPELVAARRAPREILAQVATRLQEMRHTAHLDDAREILRRLEQLNNGLSSFQVDDLPLLPEGVKYNSADVNFTALESPQITALNDKLDELVKVGERAVELGRQLAEKRVPAPPPPAPTPDVASAPDDATNGAEPALASPDDKMAGAELVYDAQMVASAQAIARSFDATSTEMSQTWRLLGLAMWPETCSLARLTEEARAQIAIAGELADANRLLGDVEALAGLNALYDKLEKPGLIEQLNAFTLWLPEPGREVLGDSVRALRQGLIQAIGQQVANILEQPDAVEQLQSKLLWTSRAEWVAQAVYQAIRDGVDGRATVAAEAGRQDEARRLWKIVVDATAPWAPTEPTERKSSRPQKQTRPKRRAPSLREDVAARRGCWPRRSKPKREAPTPPRSPSGVERPKKR